MTKYRDGYHFASIYWKNYKKSLPDLPQECFEIAVGMILGDASIYKIGHEAFIKFEQGYQQEEFLRDQFGLFKIYCFSIEPMTRSIQKDGKKQLKSFYFKTFSHKSFTKLFLLFYGENGIQTYLKKTISKNLIRDYLTAQGLAYWIMSDGSLDRNQKSMILHTQAFSKKENSIISHELNIKFKLHTKVIVHKGKYYVIKIPVEDAEDLYKLIQPYIIPSMIYKLPKMLNEGKT